MRNILKLFAVFVLSFTVTNWAIAGFPPVRIGGLLQALKTKFTLLFPNNSVVMKGGVKAYVDTGNKSHLYDGDFEGDSLATEWSVTNATATLVDTERVNGKQHLNLSVAAAIPSISQDQNITVGGSFVASCWIKTDQIDVQFCSRIDGADSVCQNVSSSNKWFKYSHQNFTSDTSTSFGVSVKGLSSITGDIKIDNCELEFGDQTQNVAQSEFVFDVNIGTVGTAFVGNATSSYTSISNSSADMVVNKGSNLEIPCSSTNPSTGLTCSVGNENFGIVFDAQVGTYEICAEFSTFVGPSTFDAYAAFQLVETPNNAQTILQEGKSRQASGGNTADANKTKYQSMNVCGTFDFATEGRKTIRLMYERPYSTNFYLLTDRSAISGQRDMHITGKYYPPQSQIVRQGTENFAKSLGTLTFPFNAGCDWAVNKTGSYQNMPVDSDCPLPTISSGAVISHSGNKTPDFILPKGSKKGLYKIRVNGIFFQDFNTSNNSCYFRFSDGVNVSNSMPEYAANSDSFDGSKTFEIILDSDLTADRNYILQASALSSTTGACAFRNTYATMDSTITVEYVPTDQKMTITGSFEQIKSTELCRARYYGNDGEVINANTEDFPFKTLDTTVGDNCGIFTNDGNTGNNTKDAIVPIRSGFYLISASVDEAGANNTVFSLYKDNLEHRSMGGFAQAGVDSRYNVIGGHYYLEKDSVYTIRATDSMTLDNTNSQVFHWINIAEIGDIASIVKNLNDNKNVKCQTKFLSADQISNGVMGNLTFNNLTIGKQYSIGGYIQCNTTNGDGAVFVNAINNSSTITRFQCAGNTGASGIASSVSPNIHFYAQNTTLTFESGSLNTNSRINGDGTKFETHIRLCELPDYYIETSEF